MNKKDIRQVAIVGAGQMGLGIGIDFVRFGYGVCLYDIKEDFGKAALDTAFEDLNLMAEMKLISKSDAEASHERLTISSDMAEAVSGADYVVEAVFDSLELKQKVFTQLDELCMPDTILATNTTTLRVTDIASKVKHPERILTTHYFQPPQFIPLVEVVGGEKTGKDTIERAAKLLCSLKKKVVVLKKDANGLIGARLQTAISREIEQMLDEGLSDNVEDIDNIITYSFGRRLTFLANFKRLDFMGLDTLYNMLKGSNFPIWKPLAEHAEKGEFGMKSGKGFYNWPGDSAKIEQLRLKRFLIQMMKQDMDEGRI